MNRKSDPRGFTLVEIMMVVVIVGVIAAVAIPNLLRSRLNANDNAIKGDLRTFSSAMESYRASRNPPVYPLDLSAVVKADPPYLDETWADVTRRRGHTMSYEVSGDQSTYTMEALFYPGESSQSFCIDHSGLIRNGTAQPGGAGCNGNSVGT